MHTLHKLQDLCVQAWGWHTARGWHQGLWENSASRCVPGWGATAPLVWAQGWLPPVVELRGMLQAFIQTHSWDCTQHGVACQENAGSICA